MSDAQRASASASNSNITTSITGLPTIVDETVEVVIDEESDLEVEPDPIRYEGNIKDVERERTVVVKPTEKE